MIHILAIPEMHGPTPGPCGYIRLFLPLTSNALAGKFKVSFSSIEDIESRPADLVIAQRLSLSSIEHVERICRFCRTRNVKFIYDIDDDLLGLGSDHPEFDLYEKFKPVVLRAIRSADQVWVSTQVLADRYQRIARDVLVVPNKLDGRVWLTRHPLPEPSRVTKFLYMGTTSHRRDFRELLLPGFLRLQKEFKHRVQLDVVGVLKDKDRNLPCRVLNPPPRTGATYPAFAAWLQSLSAYDVGLAPLLDTNFNKAKSSIKQLEYCALGLGTIVADLPPYRDGQASSQATIYAEPTPQAFYSAMRVVVMDSTLRKGLQTAAWESASRHLESAARDDTRVDIISQLFTEPGKPATPNVTSPINGQVGLPQRSSI